MLFKRHYEKPLIHDTAVTVDHYLNCGRRRLLKMMLFVISKLEQTKTAEYYILWNNRLEFIHNLYYELYVDDIEYNIV